MDDVKWIKITVDIFDDDKIKLIEAMPDGYALIPLLLSTYNFTLNSKLFT